MTNGSEIDHDNDNNDIDIIFQQSHNFGMI